MSIELSSLSLNNLASLYNLIADKPITKFKDKATGVAKLGSLLISTNQEVFEVDGEYDIRPIPALANENVDIAKIRAENPEAFKDIPPGFKIAEAARAAEIIKTTGGKTRGRKSTLTGKKITLVREKNPKRDGSRTQVRYEVYREAECKTSDDFIRICEARGLGTRREILSDLDYDSKQEFIRLS